MKKFFVLFQLQHNKLQSVIILTSDFLLEVDTINYYNQRLFSSGLLSLYLALGTVIEPKSEALENSL